MEGKVFKISWKNESLLYQPSVGYIFDTKKNRKLRISNKSLTQFPAAKDAKERTHQWNFYPFCLTLYLGNKCNLACKYCYIPNKEKLQPIHFNPEILREVVDVIALNCKIFDKPFILGFHGGNEPLLHTKAIQKCIEICQDIIQRYELELQVYCTTNGVISTKTALWASQIFHGITLSWDGDDEVHDQFRPTLKGKGSAKDVKRTAAIFANPQNGLNYFKVRATITSKSVEKLLDIVQYFSSFNIRHMDLLPVYQNLTQSISKELIPDEIQFVKNFLKAKKWAKKNNIILTYANTRLRDFHDKHCSIFQQNLTITPEGYLTSCFQTTNNQNNSHQKYMYGKYDMLKNKMSLDNDKLVSLHEKMASPYTQCRNCFNYYHCSKGCPSICPVSTNPIDSFDCRVEKWIGLANIIEASGYHISDSEIESCEDFFQNFSIQKFHI